MQNLVAKGVLSESIFYVHDSDLQSLVSQAACLTGALVYSHIIPFVTTHVVAKEETGQLQSLLAQMLSRSKQGVLASKTSLAKETPSVKLVTPKYLTSCFLAQKRLDAALFRPALASGHKDGLAFEEAP